MKTKLMVGAFKEKNNTDSRNKNIDGFVSFLSSFEKKIS
jgi:hypothetical protein